MKRRLAHRPSLWLALLACAAPAACIDSSAPPAPAKGPAAESALTAEEAVEDVTELLGDLGGFVGDGFAGLGAGGGQGWQDWLDGGGLPAFAPPAGCSMDVSILGGDISFASDCTLPSGRHVQGSFHFGLGAPCGAFGFSLSFDLLVESAPGAGDEVRVSGSVDLSFADQRLYLALELSEETQFEAVHATDIGACVVVDLPTRVLAIDGSVEHSVDGAPRHGLRIDDLQASLCEHPPYTGTVAMHGPTHNLSIEFDRPTADQGRITVDADDTHTEVSLPVLRIPGPFCADLPPVPLVLDYASCGGCGHPAPDDGDAGAPGDDDAPGNDGAGDPEAPLPGGDPDDALD